MKKDLDIIPRDFGERSDHILFTRISLAGAALCLVYTAILLPSGYVKYGMLNLFTAAVCFLSYILSKKNYYTFSFWTFFLVMPAMMFLYVYNFGFINADLYIISGAVFVSFLIKRKKYWNEIIWGISLIFFVSSKASLFLSGRYLNMNELEEFLFFPNIIASFILIYVSTVFFKTNQEKHRQELNSAVAIRDNLLSVVSHDLRTPYINLKSILELARTTKLKEDEFKGLIDQVLTEVENSSEMIDNLLFWARSQGKEEAVTIHKIKLKEVIDSVISLYNYSIEGKGIKVEVSIENEEVETDFDMLNIVIRNLVSNAIKFCDANNGEIKIRIVKSADQRTTLCFWNNGKSIDQERIKHIMDSHKSTRGSKNEKGFGLGLSMVNSYCEKLGIQLEIDSPESIGTSCRLTFPA